MEKGKKIMDIKGRKVRVLDRKYKGIQLNTNCRIW